MSHEALSVRHVSRDFRHGAVHAVRDVSLKVPSGRILGLVGVNGAGKTTLVRMCATLLTPTSGEILIGSVNAVDKPEQARSNLGLVLGGDKGFYPRSSVTANLRFFADVAGVQYRENRREVSRVLELVSLSNKKGAKVQELSRGQRQRLHIARALLGSPSLLLLDEPTNGLDPDVALETRDLIRLVANSGVGILLTSHSMPEVEELADTISVIDSGSIKTTGTLEDIHRYAGIGGTTTFSFLPSANFSLVDLSAAFGADATVVHRSVGATWFVTVLWKPGRTPDEARITTYFDSHNMPLPQDITTRKSSLEDAFLSIVHTSHQADKAS